MILFQKWFRDQILEGGKTETRRLGKKRWKVGSIHRATTNRFDPDATFAREESMRYTWEDLMKIRLGKIVKCAMEEAETGSRPDLTGILRWERKMYVGLVEGMDTYNRISGVTRE